MNTGTMMILRRGALSVLTFFGYSMIAGCLGAEVELVGESDTSDSGARIRRMNLRVETWSYSASDWVPASDDMTIRDLEGHIDAHCDREVSSTPVFELCKDDGPSDACSRNYVCPSQEALCAALVFREMAAGVVAVELQDEFGAPAFRIPPQDPESQTALEQSAQTKALAAVMTIADGFADTYACSDLRLQADIGTHEGAPGLLSAEQSTGELLASTLIEALAVGEAAAERGARVAVGVADRDNAATSNRGRAARVSWFDRNLSRLVAIQAQTGGLRTLTEGDRLIDAHAYRQDVSESAYPKLTAVGIGSQPTCEGDCDRALSALRMSGAPFRAIVDDPIIDGAGMDLSTLLAMEVSPRLAERVSLPVDGFDEAQLADYFGVTVNDFRQARTWMIHQGAAFARPLDRIAEIPPLRPNFDGTVPSPAYTYDSSTMAAPRQPPFMHYITAARATAMWGADAGDADGVFGDPTDSIRPLSRPGRAYLFDLAHSVARAAIASDRVDRMTEAGRRTQGVLASLIQDGVARDAARVEVCSQAFSTTEIQWRVRAFGADPDRLLLVDGTDMLRCGVDGDIERERCALSSPVPPPIVGSVPAGSVAGWTEYAEWSFNTDANVNSRPYWYVLRQRRGREVAGPGAYRAIAGIPWGLPNLQANQWACITLPFDESSFSTTTFALELDPTSQPRQLCGEPRGPIPLEDEIIDDGDVYETSWRHHLNVASRASAHADELGQRLIQSGLSMDQVAQASMDRVVELCGTSFNLDGLFNADGTSGQINLDELILSGVTCTGTADCPEDYECVGSACVAEAFIPSAGGRFDIEALSRCLGLGPETSTYDVVALGDSALCAWYIDDPQILCEGAAPGDCPYFPNAAGTCFGTPDMANPVSVDRTLNIFPSIPSDGSRVVTSLRTDCNALRRLRNATETVLPDDDGRAGRDLATIRTSRFFRYENVRHWAGRIGWRGYPLDYSELRVDNATWHATGYPFTEAPEHPAGPSTEWPCAAMPSEVECPPGSNSLFCAVTDCTDQLQRVAINHRMGRAAVTLTALAGLGLGNHWLPIHIENWDGFDARDIVFDDGRLDHLGAAWRLSGEGRLGESSFSGMFVFPVDTGSIVWHSENNTAVYDTHVLTSDNSAPFGVSHARPFGFVNMGAQYEGDDEERAASIARVLWTDMFEPSVPLLESPHEASVGLISTDFWGTIDDPLGSGEEQKRRLFYRALTEGTLHASQRYMRGRAASGQMFQLTHLFRVPAFNVQTGLTDFRSNQAHLFEDAGNQANFFRRDLLDAMELMCQVAESQSPTSTGGDCVEPTSAIAAGDISSVQAYLGCVARTLDELAQRQIVQNLPRDVYEAIRGESSDARPDIGTYGNTITELTGALRAQAQYPRAAADEIRSAIDDIEGLRATLRAIERERLISWLGHFSESLSTVVTCADWLKFGATCGIAAANLAMALTLTAIDNENLDDNDRRAIQQFNLSVQRRFDTLSTIEDGIATGADGVRGILARLRSTQRGAQSAVAQAGFADSDAAGRQYNLNTAMRRSYDINLLRYQDAHAAAVTSALVARRAVEQRFGLDLETQTCASLVEPPSQWAADICNAQGINYAELRDPDAPAPTAESVRAMFIGDYVRRLEQYVESYRFDYPYTSSEDVLVFSMRDDAARVRGACVAESHNLLGASNDLLAALLPGEDGARVEDGALVGWEVPAGGCTTSLDPATGVEITRGCVRVSSTEDPVGAVGYESVSPPAGWRVTFAPNSDVAGSVVDYTDAAAWVQDVELPSGLYRLSWYARAGGDIAPEAAVTAEYEGAAMHLSPVFREIPADEIAPGTMEPGVGNVLAPGWSRYFQFVNVVAPGSSIPVSVGVQAPDLGASPTAPRSVDVAGVQVVTVTATVGSRMGPLSMTQSDVDRDPRVFYPLPFIATTSAGFAQFSQCLTTNPAAFQDAWTYTCERLCAGGFDTCVEGETGEELCYWQIPFTLDEDRLLAQGGGFGGGFAFGNFNYRTGLVSVNVVGTGVRDCRGPAARSCFSDASIPFSIRHTPLLEEPGGGRANPNTYWVRSHGGGLEPVELFAGQIEQGRALASERYLTNPLSSSDRALLADYQHQELRGRPMTGRYVLRVWDTGSVNFALIEDVQIRWHYRYFTRTDASSCGR